MADQEKYHVFADEQFPLHPPTNGLVQRLMRLELRSTVGGNVQSKKQTARMMGWDPTDVIPGHTREETVKEDGEEKTIVRDNDLSEVTLPQYFARAAEIVLIGCDTEGREDEVRIGEVRRAISDFTERGLGTNADSVIS